MTTRRFFWRLAAEVLGTAGAASPKPLVVIRDRP